GPRLSSVRLCVVGELHLLDALLEIGLELPLEDAGPPRIELPRRRDQAVDPDVVEGRVDVEVPLAVPLAEARHGHPADGAPARVLEEDVHPVLEEPVLPLEVRAREHRANAAV